MEAVMEPRVANESRNSNKNTRKKPKFFKQKKKVPEKIIIQDLQKEYDNIDVAAIENFTDLPLSTNTLQGLTENGFLKPTEIQRETIALGLRGQDILGAAKTGSGKTLAFLIPIIEKLFCLQWTRIDGLGALVITPTRELAYQIFETLRKIGIYHDISAGLIIGGKDLHFEKKRMDQCNIVICTPGRLLQHMDENPLFDCNNMQVLVLDEADRCLDMGFENAMNAIIENLPAERQTLLFSATQTKSVRDLARLSLQDPMYVSVHESSMPESLNQSYVVCQLEEKISILYSFIKSHPRQKILVFMSSCKQVKYHYDLFCRLRFGTSLLQLQGTLHQLRRMAIYESFCAKSNAVLFATDIASRGLDFPEVNWVIQYDCPEDVNTYIHRAGRTARYQKGGESLLILMPSEEDGMVEELRTKKIPITKIQINPNKLQTPFRKIEAQLAQDVALKQSAQRAFVAYVKSVFLMKNKEIFDVFALNTDAYSASLGLVVPPRIRFLQKLSKKTEELKANKIKKKKNLEEKKKLISALQSTKKEMNEESSEEDDVNQDDEDESDPDHQEELETERPFHVEEADSDSEDEMLQVKRKNHELEEQEDPPEVSIEDSKNAKKKVLTKAAAAKKILRKNIKVNNKTVFDDEGFAIVNTKKEKVSVMAKEYEAENIGGIDIDKARMVLREEDKIDKERFREINKAKRIEEKRKLKLTQNIDAEGDAVEPIDEEREGDSEDDGDSGDDSGSGPDLSWLPDPDKLYGKKGSDSDEYIKQSDEEVEEVHRPIPLKRKSKTKDGDRKNKREKLCAYDEQPLDTGLSLMEDEELALQFLKGAV